MSRLIKDYLEISDHASLDDLIAQLTGLRDSLPPSTEAEIKMRGDDVFGRHLCIGYMRPLTDEEAACEGRYAEAGAPGMRRAA